MSTDSPPIESGAPPIPADQMQAVLPPDLNQSADFLTRLLERAEAVTIDSPQTYAAMASQVQRVNKLAKDFEERRLALTRPLDQLKAQWIETFRAPIELANRAVRTIKDKLLAWDAQQEALRAEAERQAREAAAKAERERQAELQRQREEAERQAEAERKAAQSAIQAAVTSGDAGAVAAAAEQLDDAERAAAERAQAIDMDAAIPTPAPVVAQHVAAAPKVGGLSKRKVWKFEVTDKAAMIAAAVNDPRVAALLVVDETALRKLVGALGAQHNVPGVRAWQEADLAAGRK